nr:hypothetical protein [Deltaproteobacteria bacterium]
MTQWLRRAAGSCGLGIEGGAATNWKRKVTAPRRIFPRALSSSATR